MDRPLSLYLFCELEKEALSQSHMPGPLSAARSCPPKQENKKQKGRGGRETERREWTALQLLCAAEMQGIYAMYIRGSCTSRLGCAVE